VFARSDSVFNDERFFGTTEPHPHIDVKDVAICLTFVYPCIASTIVNDDQQYATIFVYIFIPNQLYMFRVMSSPIIMNT